MVKKIFLLATVATFVLSCDNKQAQKVEEMVDTLTSKAETKIEETKDAIKIEGTYKGVLPCADCEGIETQVVLAANNDYTLITKYLGKGDGKPFESKGKYTKEGNIIKLDKDKVQYKFEGNKLVQLDKDGKEITGELASKYILTEISEVQYLQNN